MKAWKLTRSKDFDQNIDAVSVTRPLVISILLVAIIFLMLSCLRKRRLMRLRQEQAILEQEAAELGAASGSQFYMHQYTPPSGSPLPVGSTLYPNGLGPATMYAPPSGSPMTMLPPPPQQAHLTSPYPLANAEQTGMTYIPAQDGATNPDDVPSAPPPPYTAQSAK
ncbi:hypothetical protein BGZ94_002543 [Podila epigama]|nr:hypothetical protein BGZ94_002543 [Podila epigama]